MPINGGISTLCPITCYYIHSEQRRSISCKSIEIAAISITLSDLQGRPPAACLFDFSYSCAAMDKISTDSASRGPSAIAELLVTDFGPNPIIYQMLNLQ